jgi:hypothetical protein
MTNTWTFLEEFILKIKLIMKNPERIHMAD